MKSFWWAAVVWGGWSLVGCGPRAANCTATQIEHNGMCYGNCNVVAPPCYAADAGLVLAEAGASDATADSAMDGLVCGAGSTVCSGACVDTQSDPSHCGRCGAACMAGAGERGVCMAGQCRAECVAGFERVGMSACDAPVLRLLGPMSTSYVSSQRPTLRWVGAAGLDGAVVEVCSSRDCAMVVQRGVVGGGATSWRVERALSAGVYFWRVRGRSGMVEGTRTSAVWEFVVGARDRGTDTQWGTLTDVNGDGFGDVVVGANNVSGWTGDWLGYWGALAGIPMMASWMSRDPQVAGGARGSASVASVGDVNGDGFGDVALGAAEGRDLMLVATGAVTIVFGSATGLRDPQQVFGASDGDWFGAAVSAAGDVNGDGYGDVVVGAPHASAPAAQAGKVYLFLGSATGLRNTPAQTWSGARAMDHWGASVSGAHEINGDGRPDLVIAAPDAFDPTEGESNVGVVACFLGSASGLLAVPTRTWTRVERVGEAAAGYRLGASVAQAGDVDGDGFGDLVFGSDDERWKRDVLLVRGAASGVAVTFERIEATESDARRVGVFVDVGDANGDGRDDLLFAVNLVARSELASVVRLGGVGALGGAMNSMTLPGLRLTMLGDLNGDGRRELAGVRQSRVGPTPAELLVAAGSASNEWEVDWTVSGGWIR
ncbi:MAG: FG-GAP-like repeat-containing protein [Polyangiales bacterium]